MTRDKLSDLSGIRGGQDSFGNKAVSLCSLSDSGFLVPKSLFISKETASLISAGCQDPEELAKEISRRLPLEAYAVRSSALSEDTIQTAAAGKFLSLMPVKISGLAAAIMEVVSDHSRQAGPGGLAIIIQEYIEPDWSGVAFSRDPSGGREIVIEYAAARGSEIVGGRLKPDMLRLYRGQPIKSSKNRLPLNCIKNLYNSIKAIENKLGFPQDIEWCSSAGNIYFLQSRPITSLSGSDYEQILSLERLLPEGDFYLEKTELTETAPRPTPLTLSILEKIYAADGPVAKAYKACGASYRDSSFLKVVGGQLYCDRQEELKGLFPSFAYRGSSKIGFASVKGLARTLRNLLSLSFFRFRPDKLISGLESAWQQPSEDSFSGALDYFLSAYQAVFSVNLAASQSFKRLETIAAAEGVSSAELIGLAASFAELPRLAFKPEPAWTGNSLERSDVQPFFSADPGVITAYDKLSWWEGLPAFKRESYRRALAEAASFERLREYGRWLAVKGLNAIRNQLIGNDKEILYFATVAELLSGKVPLDACRVRQKAYQLEADVKPFPRSLSSSFRGGRTVSGLSAGIAEGLVVDAADLEAGRFPSQPKILYTEDLLPGLIAYFPDIVGIISENGGLLSHLAIMAREQGLPVVSSIAKRQGLLGKVVVINGSSGQVKAIKS